MVTAGLFLLLLLPCPQVSFDYLKVQWMLLDASLKQEWQRIENLRPGEQVTIVDRSLDEKVGFILDMQQSAVAASDVGRACNARQLLQQHK
jgi:hypothetical protein